MGQLVGNHQLNLQSNKRKKLINTSSDLLDFVIYTNSYLSSSNKVNSTKFNLFSWWQVTWQVQL